MIIACIYSSISLPLFQRGLSSRKESLFPAKLLEEGIGLYWFFKRLEV